MHHLNGCQRVVVKHENIRNKINNNNNYLFYNLNRD